jgi:outer membrane protein assembly factor BamB
MLGTSSDQIYLHGLDSKTGKPLWKNEISPGRVVSGIAIEVLTVDNKAVYFRPAPTPTDRLSAQLVVADPATGRDLVTTRPHDFVSNPEACDEDAKSVCVEIWEGGSRRSMALRPGARELAPDQPDGIYAGMRGVGEDGLMDFLVRNPDKIGVVHRGKVLWKRDVAQIFGPGHSTDYGWDLVKTAKSGVYYGSVGWDGFRSPATTSLPLKVGTVTAGFRASDGRPLWVAPATGYACLGAIRRPAASGADFRDLPIRCRYTGVLKNIGPHGGTLDADGLTVTVERFDPVTGKTLWSAPLGDAPDLAGVPDAGALPAVVDDVTVLLRTKHGTVAIRLDNGETRPAGKQEIAWCATDAAIRYRYPMYFDNEADFDRRGGVLQYPCTPDRGRTESLPSSIPIGIATEVAGGLKVVVGPESVAAYRVT